MEEISKPTAEQIENSVISTIKEMAKVYLHSHPHPNIKESEGHCFSDGYEPRGLISTAEALCCITIPYFSIKSFAVPFWESEIIDHTILRESVEYLLNGYLKDDPAAHGSYGFGGTPYIDFRYKGKGVDGVKVNDIKENLDFIDAACFVVSALADLKAMELHRKLLIKKNLIPTTIPPLFSDDIMLQIDRRITNGFQVIVKADCGPGNGFCYTSEAIETKKTDYLYFTWNVLETMEALYPYVKNQTNVLPVEMLKREIIVGDLTVKEWFSKFFADKLAHLTGRFLSERDNPQFYMGKGIIDFSIGELTDRHLYYNLFALQGLLCTESTEFEELTKSLKTIMDFFGKPEIKKGIKRDDYGKFDLEGTLVEKYKLNKTWSERGFEPLLLKSISCMNIRFSKEQWPVDFATECRRMQSELFNNLMADTCKDLSIGNETLNNLWDADRFSIYYTERSIEAICRYYQDLYEKDGKVPAYSKELAELTTWNSEPPSSLQAQQSFVVNIDANVIRESIISDATNMVREIANKQLEALDKDALFELIKEKLSIEIEQIINSRAKDILENKLRTFFSDLASRIKTGKVKGGDQVIARSIVETLAHVITCQAATKDGQDDIASSFLGRILAAAILNAGEGKADENDIKILAQRIQLAFEYLAKHCENNEQQIDFLKSIVEAHSKELIITKNKKQ